MESKSESWKMFDRIASTYDLLNHLLSFNIDVAWRRKVAEFAPPQPFYLADLATGTGDLLLTLLKKCPQIEQAVGVDLSQEMIRLGDKKIWEAGFYSKASLRVGDASKLRLLNESYDMVTMAFGIRNTPDPLQTLREIQRIMKFGGITAILEFSLPKNFLVKNLFLFYFRFVLPIIGGLISKNYKAYRYLNQSVEKFPYGEEFVKLMKQANLINIETFPLSWGIVTLYIARK